MEFQKDIDLADIVVPNESDFEQILEQVSEETEQNADAPKGVRYEERFVAFVDILGFKDIIHRSAKEEEYVFRIHNALSLSQDYTAENFSAEVDRKYNPDDFDDRRHTFSDFIVMSVGPSIPELGLLVYAIFKKYRNLLSSGFTCRGGIAKGKLLHIQNGNHHSAPQMIFGPAFVEAYHLESLHADTPRVILQRTVWQFIEEYLQENQDDKLAHFLGTHVKRSDDGPAYIDIFADFNVNAFYKEFQLIEKEVSQIKDYICKALDESNDRPQIFKKHAYLARLFNKALEPNSNLANYKIPTDKLPC